MAREEESGGGGVGSGDLGERSWIGEGEDEARVPEAHGAAEDDGVDDVVGDSDGAWAFVAEDVVAEFPEEEEGVDICDETAADVFAAEGVSGRVFEADGGLV